MNTKDNWLTTATIHDEPRRALWSKVFPDAMVPITSMFTIKVHVPGHLNADVYMLDLDAITDLQREHLIMVISTKFDIAVDDVRKDIDKGVPILAEGVTVATRDQGMFFSVIDFNPSDDVNDEDEFVDHFEDYE